MFREFLPVISLESSSKSIVVTGNAAQIRITIITCSCSIRQSPTALSCVCWQLAAVASGGGTQSDDAVRGRSTLDVCVMSVNVCRHFCADGSLGTGVNGRGNAQGMNNEVLVMCCNECWRS